MSIGDLREGLWFESLSLIDEIVEQILKLKNIKLIPKKQLRFLGLMNRLLNMLS